MTNRVEAAHAALEDLLKRIFPDPTTVVRNADGMRHLDHGDLVIAMEDDDGPETISVVSGPIYDLKALPVVTIARKATEAARRLSIRADVDRLRDALAEDVTLSGVVEDARIDEVEPAEMDRTKWVGGGLDVTVRLLFAAPSKGG